MKQSSCGKQRRQRGWNDFSTSSYYTRSGRTVKLNFETRESQMTFLLSTIYPSALVIISLPSPTFHCMFTWRPSLLCISCAAGRHKKRKTAASWTGRAMHWLSFYFGNFRETWTRNFNPRDALFLLFNFRDSCVGPPLYPPQRNIFISVDFNPTLFTWRNFAVKVHFNIDDFQDGDRSPSWRWSWYGYSVWGR